MALNIYDVDKKYIEFLQKHEIEKRGFTHVPNMDYGEREQKFVCGVVFKQNGLNYYVPVSSNKTERKSTILIEFSNDKFNKVKGSLNFAYMFPVPDCAIERKDIFDEVDLSKRTFLFGELKFIKSHKMDIFAKAKNVYFQIINHKDDRFEHICCDFKLLEAKAKVWEKEHMKENNRELYFVTENEGIIGISNFLNYDNSIERLKMGVPLVIEAVVDKEGNLYSRYDLDKMFRNVSVEKEWEMREKMEMKECYLEVKDIKDFEQLYNTYYSNCIISPSVMNLNTSNKFNTTLRVLTDPSYCFDKKTSERIQMELIEAKPLTVEKIASFSEKYIDKEALSTLKSNCEKNSNDPTIYQSICNEVDWTSYNTQQTNLKQREKEIIWGSELAGADDYAKDLEVAQSVAKDIDGADIPNDTPIERQGVKHEVQKAKKQKEKNAEKELAKEKKVVRVEKKGIEK